MDGRMIGRARRNTTGRRRTVAGRWATAAGVLVALGLAACGGGETTAPGGGSGSGGSGAPGTGDDGGSDTEEPAGPRIVTIEMEDISYNAPGGGDFLTIGLGERVRWVNLDGTFHTVTSTSAPPGGKPINSGRMQPGAEFVFTPRVAGTWEYSCLEYPNRMANARIRVLE